MAAQLRPTRLDVTDRFPMLGFTLRTNTPPRVAEVVLATDVALFTKKEARTSANFYSSREHGTLTIAGAEAVYVVPPEVLARFVAADRLYFALATATPPKADDWTVEQLPTDASPYVSLSGLSDRALRRVRMFPARRGSGRYGAGAPAPTLDWAGDRAQPGMTPLAPPAAAAPAASAQPPAHVHYDDGFGPLPPLQAAPAAAPPTPAPVAAPAAPAAQGLEADSDTQSIDGPVFDEDYADEAAPQAMALGVRPRALAAAEYAGARIMPSPAYNSGRRGQAVDRIVIHITGAPQSRYLGAHFTREEANSSSHYMVDQNGAIIQFVREQDTAWHAGPANRRSIGIEHVAIQRGGARYPRRDGTVQTFPYTPPTDVEYRTSAALVASLCRKYALAPDRTTIIGHREADPGTPHSACPDGAWDWDGYMALVAEAYAASLPASAPAAAEGLGLAQGLDVDPEDMGIDGPACSDDAPPPALQAGALALNAKEYDRVSRVAISPAFTAGRAGQAVNRIVIHITDAPTTVSTVSHFTRADANSSAHYLVGQDGEIVQFVSEADTAWHAKGANRTSIGIEHVAVKQGGATYGTTTYPYMPPTDVQYSESAALVAHLCDKYGLPANRTTIVGHREADPRTSHSTCPDGAWNWDHFMNLVTNRICAPQPTGQGLSAPVGEALVFGQEDFDKIRRLHAGDYRDLFQWREPASIRSRVEARGFRIQHIEDAVGDLNLDFYKVRINRFPSGMTAQSLLARFISDTNSFVDSGICSFDPYDSSDAALRASADPVGACLNLDINRSAPFYDPRGWDDAAIVISAKGPAGQPTQFYTVTTINTPNTGDHPVSGHRQFGYYVEDGVTYFYTRGADRATLAFPGTEGAIYSGGEALWRSFQRTLSQFINSQGGEATVVAPFSERFNPSAIRIEFNGWGESSSAQSLSADDDWSVNWDEVDLIAQPTGVSCWATAAAMVDGWRRRQSVSIDAIAAFDNLTVNRGLPLTDAARFGQAIGFTAQPNACYTPEGFRQILEANGPLWVAGFMQFPTGLSGHAVVVTGMYRENGNYFVRLTDPWDHVAGNAPGRTMRHDTGSRYIMTWEAFSQEYEATGGQADFAQLLHTGGTFGHTINRGSAASVGYAQGLAAGSDESFGVGTSLTRRTEERDGRRYDLAQLSGMVEPANALAGGAGTPALPGERVVLDDWPYIDGPSGRTQAGIAIAWQFQGGAVGNVVIEPTEGRLLDGWSASVRADIVREASTPERVNLGVRVTSTFSRQGEQDQVAVTEVLLAGDGRQQTRYGADRSSTGRPGPAAEPQRQPAIA
jgi:N-acetyl-anhydromuramyl-L-alanine amidase AmpD